MSDHPLVNFRTGDTTGVAAHLNREFAAVGDAVTDLGNEVAAGNEALHGTGTEETGDVTTVGTGLSCVVAAQSYWVVGRRYTLAADLTVALPGSSTRHLYMDADQVVTQYAARQSPNPEGTWYLGTATTDSGSCTAVDDTNADRVANLAGLETRMDAVEAGILELDGVKTVLGLGYYDVDGDPVTGEASVHDRLTALESGGGGGGVSYWGGLERSSGDPTTIPEYVASQIGESGGGDGGGGTGGTTSTTTVTKLPSDLEIANHLRLVLRTMHALPGIEETQLLAYHFVPGISDDALYDAVATTAPVDKVHHRIG